MTISLVGRAFLTRVSESGETTYNDALANFCQHAVQFSAKTCYGMQLPQETITIQRGGRIDDQPFSLGQTGTATFLYSDGTEHSSPNEDSPVLRIDINGRSILFMGDAEAGGRQDPSNAPSAGSIEGSLLDCCSAELEANVLIVGHHGSMTSYDDTCGRDATELGPDSDGEAGGCDNIPLTISETGAITGQILAIAD